jgi:hypothetical protein
MLSSINWLRQLIARDKAKQPQLKNQLTKSHESSQPTIGRDKDAFGDLQKGTVYRSKLLHCRKLNISNLRIDLRFRHQAVWREAHGQDLCSCLKKSVADHNWFALPERPVSDACAPFV